MADEKTPTTPSEQSTTTTQTAVTPPPEVKTGVSSEQGKEAQKSETGTQEVTKPTEVDLEAKLREAREKGRYEALSQLEKQKSEAIRIERERARQEREILLQQAGAYIPDEQLAQMRQTIQGQDIKSELEQYRAWATEQQRLAAYQQVAASYAELVKEAGLNWDDLPADVRGNGPDGFPERFAKHTAKLLAKTQKEVAEREKKAREQAERDTEQKLGVTKVGTGSPSGGGRESLESLSKQIADAASRGDRAKVEELRDAVYKEAGIG